MPCSPCGLYFNPHMRFIPADTVVDFKAADVTAGFDEAGQDGVLRAGSFLCLPDDAGARLIPNQPRPVMREAEMRRHPVRSPRSLGFFVWVAQRCVWPPQ